MEVIKTEEERFNSRISEIERQLDIAVSEQDIEDAKQSFDTLVRESVSLNKDQHEALSELKKRFGDLEPEHKEAA